jgi:hypothetical protein
MVQVEPNLTLTLKHLAPHGAVVSAEQQVALMKTSTACYNLCSHEQHSTIHTNTMPAVHAPRLR